MNQTKLLTVLFFIWGFLFSQESIGGRPYSLDNSLRTNISNFQTSGINAEELLIQDANRVGPAPFRYGYRYETNINMNNHGSWETLNNGDAIWRLQIESQDAFSIGLIYDNFYLPEGTTFYVYNQNEVTILGGYTNDNNAEVFSTPQIVGEVVFLEYYEPANTQGIPNISSLGIATIPQSQSASLFLEALLTPIKVIFVGFCEKFADVELEIFGSKTKYVSKSIQIFVETSNMPLKFNK